MKYHLITYGCQMNKSDAERIAALLEKIGYSPTSNKNEADLIVIIVCSVRQSAVDRLSGQIRNLAKLKIKNSKLKILLTGCLLPKDKEKLKSQVDLIFEINQLPNLPLILSRLEGNSKNKKIKNLKLKITNYLEIKPKFSTFPIAYIPIMTGCNNFCTYCVVPYTRGREVSRPAKEIIDEVKELIKKGYKMIILLGQNVNSYQSPIQNSKAKMPNTKKIDFPKLLKMVNNLKGNFWLTFITSHPKDLSDELMKTMARCKKVMPYLHLPVQSGDNEILKKMNRQYTATDYKNLVKKIKKTFEKYRRGLERNLSLSTDIIVGFPGETKKQFENTAKLMREVKFDMAYIAKYSPRPQTAASKLRDNISIKEKERRWKILTEILQKTSLENNKKYLGKVIPVLVENKKNHLLFGQTRSFKKVKMENLLEKKQKISIGDMIKVKIKKIKPFGLEGVALAKFS
ncbi:MAG: tRNA (N6-isopentenyl adenosine(37)-C2)-methylthiotransferase MiaB [Patescibacteria group bacterium]|nr:tRNA (N6-isopentenyl adenosine(37)-C2)-methylthiotransferase MiaB [Patescibacteria group bacterium]